MQPMPPIPPRSVMPQPQGSPPQGPSPAPGGAPPAPGSASPRLSGPQPVANTGYNKDIQNILWSRIQALGPQAVTALDKICTPETLPILGKIFPELIPLLNQSTAAQQMGQNQPSAQPTGQGPMPRPGAPAQSQNPLSNPPTPGVSQGLTGS